LSAFWFSAFKCLCASSGRIETKEEALSIAFQCMAYIGETVDIERDLILVSERTWKAQAVWDVSFLYRDEELTCNCSNPIILEGSTVPRAFPDPGIVPDNPGYYFYISKMDGRIVEEGFGDLTPDIFKVPCVLK
jgi:hypothetical protein